MGIFLEYNGMSWDFQEHNQHNVCVKLGYTPRYDEGSGDNQEIVSLDAVD